VNSGRKALTFNIFVSLSEKRILIAYGVKNEAYMA
jgi:hypothetical protein